MILLIIITVIVKVVVLVVIIIIIIITTIIIMHYFCIALFLINELNAPGTVVSVEACHQWVLLVLKPCRTNPLPQQD